MKNTKRMTARKSTGRKAGTTYVLTAKGREKLKTTKGLGARMFVVMRNSKNGVPLAVLVAKVKRYIGSKTPAASVGSKLFTWKEKGFAKHGKRFAGLKLIKKAA